MHVSTKMRTFAVQQARQFAGGIVIGALLGMFYHLVIQDSRFTPALREKWKSLPLQSHFDGISAYKNEFWFFLGGILLLILSPMFFAALRYLRAWWAGIVSLFGASVAAYTLFLLRHLSWKRHWVFDVAGLLLLCTLSTIEYWRNISTPSRQSMLRAVSIPARTYGLRTEYKWEPSSSDDPIDTWDQDIIGRAAIVETLVDHTVRQRTPIVALHGGLGDGKTSVLNLLRKAIEGHAVVVSFSAWLPGSEKTFAMDLFDNIATECKRTIHVPQLRRHALAYARTISGSVSLLGGLKEILPTQSQKQEVDDLRKTFARVPIPIVVLLDEIDRMHKDEALVLLKVLRGASSIPNVTFVCAFSPREFSYELSEKTDLSGDFLEKFFPVAINLTGPDPDVLGKLFQEHLQKEFASPRWFATTERVQKFPESLEELWRNGLSNTCTNLRKLNLVLNDIASTARPIVGEVNALDLIVVESLRRFYPEIYRLIRTNPLYLTYAQDNWRKGRIFIEDQKKKGADEFFDKLKGAIGDRTDIEHLLSWIFPDYASKKSGGMNMYSLKRPTGQDIAAREKRICDVDYFPIYFRSSVPEEMFSAAEMGLFLKTLEMADTEMKVEAAYKEVLDTIPPGHQKRSDFLWKLGQVMEHLDDVAVERLAFAASSRAADYAYDLINIGEAAHALNIVFIAAQRMSKTTAVQEILSGAMFRAADDTFAFRLWEYTKDKDRNRVLTDFSFVDVAQVKQAFVDRMRSRYGAADVSKVTIKQGDWRAFHTWVDFSAEDKAIEQDFWRRFVGTNRQKLAQAINLVYPGGTAWEQDPTPLIDKLFPIAEIGKLIDVLPDIGDLEEPELKAIERLQALLQGKYPNPLGQ